MFIPNELKKLIHLYNEKGIFLLNQWTVYWFNGKKTLIEWCHLPQYSSRNIYFISVIQNCLCWHIHFYYHDYESEKQKSHLYAFSHKKGWEFQKISEYKQMDEINNYMKKPNSYHFQFNNMIYEINKDGITYYENKKVLVSLPKKFDITQKISSCV